MSNKSEKFKDVVSLLILSTVPTVIGSVIGHTEYGSIKATILGGLLGLAVIPFTLVFVWSALRWLTK